MPRSCVRCVLALLGLPVSIVAVLRAEVRVLPRMVLRVRKAVRHLAGLGEDEFELTGERNEQSWYDMLERVQYGDRERERRIRQAERALNRLSAG